MKKMLATILLVLWASGALSAQGNLLADIQAARAAYPTPMTPQQLGMLLNSVAWARRAEGWGLFRKDQGNRCPIGQVSISCDILYHQPSNTLYDVLADVEGSATPQFGPPMSGDFTRFVAPIDLTPAPVPVPIPPPNPQPIPAIDLTGVYSRLQAQYDQLERVYADLAAKSNDLALRINQVDGHLAEHDAKTSRALELLKNPIIYTIIGGLLAGRYAFGQQQPKTQP